MNETVSAGPLLSFDEINSIADVKKLNDLDNYLKCSICYDYFNTCVITHCSHNFCSLCIRRYIQYKTECPQCYDELHDSQLRPNRVIDTFVQIFPVLKDKIIKQLRTLKALKPNQVYTSPSKDFESVTPSNKRPLNKIKDGKQEENTTAVYIQPISENTSNVSSSPCTSSNKIIIPTMFQSPSKKNTPGPQQSSTNMVPCPVCSVEVRDTYINSHLDDCLNRQKDLDKKNVKVQVRAVLPKLVPNLMSISELRAKAKSYGLSSHGNPDVLKNRIQRYTAMYNAECDKPNPRPVPEIIKMLEKEEKALASQKVPKSMFSVPTKNKEELNAQYLKENKNSFDKLIKMTRMKRANKKEDENLSSVENTIEYCKPSTSKANISWDAIDKIDIEEMKIEVPFQNATQSQKVDPLMFCNGFSGSNKNEHSDKDDVDDDDDDDLTFSVPSNRIKSRRLNFDNETSPTVSLSPIQFVKVETSENVFEKSTDEEDCKLETFNGEIAELGSPILKKRIRTKRNTSTNSCERDSPVLFKKSLRKRKR